VRLMVNRPRVIEISTLHRSPTDGWQIQRWPSRRVSLLELGSQGQEQMSPETRILLGPYGSRYSVDRIRWTAGHIGTERLRRRISRNRFAGVWNCHALAIPEDTPGNPGD